MQQSGSKKWIANSFIAGAGSGIIVSITTCSLDVIKTRLQAQQAVPRQQGYQGVLGIFKTILRQDGIRGLYRGLGPTILAYLPNTAIYFAVYDGVKARFGEHPPGDGPRSRHIYLAPQPEDYQPLMREHPWILHTLSAMIAGAASATCTNPLWVIQTRFMTQSRREVRYRHTFDAARIIHETEGIRAFYRGLLPSLIGITHPAVQFPLYEWLKRWAQGDSDVPLRNHAITLPCSTLSKIAASLATYPHEVIRTRLQTLRPPISEDVSSDRMIKRHDRRSLIYVTRKMVEKEGWTSLYRGLSVNLFRTVPNNVVGLLAYELLLEHLSSREYS
ncbi:hypothetical protein SCLCIDRAFT_1218328 [Scleroderma citrinum Foug A]|uniref:Mitochondrial carrier protein n=1 Tax=Scleroderma citrinum Foug A TaxID=1036808 RepID=A0A0C2ZA78_9AGAM|nr:hypothetical protein SCLCIDRAFT_1218328 [Scleroderma citrinum Foug A]